MTHWNVATLAEIETAQGELDVAQKCCLTHWPEIDCKLLKVRMWFKLKSSIIPPNYALREATLKVTHEPTDFGKDFGMWHHILVQPQSVMNFLAMILHSRTVEWPPALETTLWSTEPWSAYAPSTARATLTLWECSTPNEESQFEWQIGWWMGSSFPHTKGMSWIPLYWGQRKKTLTIDLNFGTCKNWLSAWKWMRSDFRHCGGKNCQWQEQKSSKSCNQL